MSENTQKKHPLEAGLTDEFISFPKSEAQPMPEPEPEKVVPLQRDEGLKTYDPKIEKPIHRIMCYLASQGETPKAIATKTNYTPEQIRNILKSERSRLLIAQIIQDNHEDGVQDLLKGGAIDAVMEIRSLSKDAKSETIRLNSCKDILDRVQGKPIPIQPDAGDLKTPIDPADEKEALEKEIQKLSKESP